MYLLIELFTLPYAMPPTGYALAPLTGAMKCSRTPCLPTLPLTFRLSSRYWSNSVLGVQRRHNTSVPIGLAICIH